MAAKNASAAQKPEPSPSRTSATASPRESLDVPPRTSTESADRSRDASSGGASPRSPHGVANDTHVSPDTAAEDDAQVPEQVPEKEETELEQDTRLNGDHPVLNPPQVEVTLPAEAQPDTIDAVHEARIRQLEGELETIQLQHQEETHDYVE